MYEYVVIAIINHSLTNPTTTSSDPEIADCRINIEKDINPIKKSPIHICV